MTVKSERLIQAAKRTNLGEFNNLEGVLNECVRGKRFEVMKDSDRDDKYVGKIVVVDRKYGYGYEKDREGNDIYIGNVVWTHFEESEIIERNENVTFYLRELKPLDRIENPQFFD
ncbi:MAG: hypothetical protein KC516_01285 [Nanoarchaeota archaeon]|nr:hypothetical protein [Nanoarchaeota archaeon]